jgi:periplasmic protein TonB
MNKIWLVCCCICFFALQLNAQKLKDSTFTEGNICWKGKVVKGKMTGEWIGKFCKTAKIAGTVNYLNGQKNGTENRFQSNGVRESVFQYEAGQLNGKTIHFTPVKGDTLGVINYVNNMPDGKWLLYTWRGQLMQTIEWKNGEAEEDHPFNKFTKIAIPPVAYTAYVDLCRKYIGIFYENLGAFIIAPVVDTINGRRIPPPPPPPPPPLSTSPPKAGSPGTLRFAEEMPAFPGKEGALQLFIQNNIIYPESAKEEGMQGIVYISFQINPDGSVSDEEIAKSVPGAPELTGEALRLISLMPNWSPGKMDGKNTTVQMSLPLRFVIK